MSVLTQIIQAADAAQRDRALDDFCRSASVEELRSECASLESFRRQSDNLYQRVRALFFLYAIHRFHLPDKLPAGQGAPIPFEGYTHLLRRRFEEAIEAFLAEERRRGPGDGISSALAAAYHRLAFQTLADQVRRSVRSVRGNQWMFRTGHPADHPLRVRPELLEEQKGLFPLLRETTPVRMDLSHSGWSDIFFLGMDYPEGARVLNVSIDLSLHDGSQAPQPPVEAYFRVIDRPVLRLASIDLGVSAEIDSLAEVFDFARDYLGLVKAAVIAAGLVPPGMEGAEEPLSDLLARLVGPGRGIEVVSRVNDIPKGSRLAVSTNLLAALIAACMRATGQTALLKGGLDESERRVVAARAILGEWIGGSGGGWQDSGGVWPGVKLIEGVAAAEGDPEYGVSRGRLLPQHRILDLADGVDQSLQDSLVLVHGGMAQDVGPILEMVTEKYLLRSEKEWAGRDEAMRLLDEVVAALEKGDVPAIGAATQRNFDGPIQAIIPWASNFYTECLVEAVRREFGADFWGFWMLGGMAGGGMGFIFAPHRKAEAQASLQRIMSATKKRLEHAVPFAMEPVVYDFAVNRRGTWADLLSGDAALLPPGYYAQTVPGLLRRELRELPPGRRAELGHFATACRQRPELAGMVESLFDRLLPQAEEGEGKEDDLESLLAANGFDRQQHEAIRADLRSGRIGLAQNRLPVNSKITDAAPEQVIDATSMSSTRHDLGMDALRQGAVACVSLAGGVGSRWTQGAGVVKALNPFCRLAGRHRTFVEVHLAKSRRCSQVASMPLPHVFTTSYMTHAPIASYLKSVDNYGYDGPLLLSPGRMVGLRLVPMARDLRFAWEELPQQLLDERAQKMQESLNAALINWAEQAGEGSDYTDNLPLQCMHPVGHWYDVTNLLRNGVIEQLLTARPQLRYLMVHNIDTLGADVDPALLGAHIESGAALGFEVITRRLEDRGGGLAQVDGHLRLVEGLAMPREEAEFDLSYYNTSTTWIDIDRLLTAFGLERQDLGQKEKVDAAVQAVARRIPTYVTLKEVKKRWGKGQEDVFPVTQFEKLWGDMTVLPELDCRFLVVPRRRGQQLKEPAQLDSWLRDGSAAHVEGLGDWSGP
jgi:hypothetical protein